MSIETDRISELLTYWFGELDGPDDVDMAKWDLWWKSRAKDDAEIATRFGSWVADARAGRLDHWAGSAQGSLALVLLLDQLTRCLGRGSAQAYAGDPQALTICCQAIDTGRDRELRLIERGFLYMPLMHAEDRHVARRSIEVFRELSEAVAGCSHEDHPDFLPHAVNHAKIVEEFGRYPHRNALLDREATSEEEQFFAAGASSFGQGKK